MDSGVGANVTNVGTKRQRVPPGAHVASEVFPSRRQDLCLILKQHQKNSDGESTR